MSATLASSDDQGWSSSAAGPSRAPSPPTASLAARTRRRRKQMPRRRAPLRTLLLSTCVACCLLLATVTRSVSASEGDRSAEYQHCVDSQIRDVCGPDGVDDGMTGRLDPLTQPDSQWLPFSLRITGWNCIDNAKYHCTHKVTNDALRNVQQIRQRIHRQVRTDADAARLSGSALREREARLVKEELDRLPRVRKQMVQYYGKWVFVRIWGAQEPLSVLFSLLNLWVHAAGAARLRRSVSDAFPLKAVYTIHALISCNAWLWSSVFHTRDKPLTERLDYFSAAAVMLSGLFFTICRLFRLHPATPPFVLLLRVLAACYTLHVLYLSFGRFDYGYNMTANVIVGLSHNLLWLFYSLRPGMFNLGSSSISTIPAAGAAARREALRSNKPHGSLISGGGIVSSSSSAASSSSSSSSGGNVPPAPVVMASAAARGLVGSRESRRRLQLLLLGMTLAAMLELLDFPPLWRAVDAHCLWHLSTIPLAHLWYDWLIDDAHACVSSGWFVGDALSAYDPVGRAIGHADARVARARSALGAQVRRVDWGAHASTLRTRADALAARFGVNAMLPLLGGHADAQADGGGQWHRGQQEHDYK